MARRILFVTPTARRAGAPLMLLNFVRWVRAETDFELAVLVREAGGELQPEFAQVASLATLKGAPAGAPGWLRTLRRIGWADELSRDPPADSSRLEKAVRIPARRAAAYELRRRLFDTWPPDLVYINSLGSGSALSLIPSDVPVLTHVHEAGLALRLGRRYDASGIAQILGRTDRFIAASQAVSDGLVAEYGVDPAKIVLCHSFIPIADAPHGHRREDICARLGVDPDAFIVGAMGTVDGHKGTDLFIQVAKRAIDRLEGREVVFVWIGASIEHWWAEAVEHDVAALGLTGRVVFAGAVSDPTPLIDAMDVFVCTSRSDAFPLASLEAAARGKPVVCFVAGGMTEFLSPDEQLTVPYLDIDSMAERICVLLRSEPERQRLGAALAARVRARHRIEVSAPKLLGQVEDLLGNGQRADR